MMRSDKRPIRSNGVQTALVLGFHNFAKGKEAAARVERLERRAQAYRTVVAATVRLMEAHGLGEPAADLLCYGTP